jgi:hypothetical protein
MPSTLDTVALALTEPISRRRALRLAAGAAVASFFGAKADSALADCPSCPRMSDPPNYSQQCAVPRGVGCIFVCCPLEFACCTASHGVVCCREGYTCGPPITSGQEQYPTCKCINDCGGNCCKPDETCADIETGLCCAVPCGKTCCRSGEKCVDPDRGVCCKSYEQGCRGRNETICCDESLETCCAGSTVTQCCGLGQTCGDQGNCKCKRDRPVECLDDCCKRTDRCCHSLEGKGFCIPRAWKCCGDSFAMPGEECCAGRFHYNPRFQRCCGLSGVCPTHSECCPDGCCPAGSSCCAHGCCNAAGQVVGPKRPFEQVSDRRAARIRRKGTKRRDIHLRAEVR